MGMRKVRVALAAYGGGPLESVSDRCAERRLSASSRIWLLVELAPWRSGALRRRPRIAYTRRFGTTPPGRTSIVDS
jgi:hypothetical protein